MIQVDHIYKTYGTGEAAVHAVNNVSFCVEQGEFIAVHGASGSGKSTLFHMIGGLETPSKGTVRFCDIDLYKLKEEERTIFRRKSMGFIFQQFHLIKTLSVYENIILPLDLNNMKIDKKYLDEILSLLGLTEKVKKLPGQLSGGEQQRVAIGRALITRPDIILADEPTGNLDSKNSKEVIQILKENNKILNQTILLITHDENIAHRAPRRIYLKDGSILEDVRVDEKEFSIT